MFLIGSMISWIWELHLGNSPRVNGWSDISTTVLNTPTREEMPTETHIDALLSSEVSSRKLDLYIEYKYLN